jgi:transposase
LEAIIERAHKEPLNRDECELLLSVSQTLRFVTEQLENKSISINRLRKLLFGSSTETLKTLESGESPSDASKDQDQAHDGKPTEPKEKPKGHGRNGADAYTGAKKVNIAHQTLKPGDCCPDCLKGTVYETNDPGHKIRVTGQAPLQATVYELQKLRCGLCGKVFTATSPNDIGSEKYDAESVSMIALLKYGTGVPFNRLQGLQANLGIPLSASTQWETLSDREYAFSTVYQALIVAAAQGKILHNDDTTMRVLDRTDLKRPPNSDRKGIFTSGIVSVGDGHQIALFFTGHQHAGENLADILKHRASELNSPIQMSDGLSRNVPGEFKTLLANCLAHGRRKFVDIYEAFPSECHTVLEMLAKVYTNDTVARDGQLSEIERLDYHQQHSRPLMAELKDWMTQQLEEHLVEPNSGLGQAIRYMLKHWNALTLFLREPGAPLDNNLCERALKKAILNRKNAYYYRTANGARIGDMFMSLIHTCELNAINPFDYLTDLQKHADSVSPAPNAWMPWSYQEAFRHLDTVGAA